MRLPSKRRMALMLTPACSPARYWKNMPHIPAPYPYRFEGSVEECGAWAAGQLAQEIENQGAETVAAFIAEPIAGATLGAVVPPDNYWPRIREICDHYGVLIIADEVMT